MAKRDHMDLMLYADGELSSEDAAEVRAQVESSEDDAAVVSSLGQISELARGHLELAGDDVEESRFDAMWQAIERTVTANGKAEDPIAVPRTRSQPAQSEPGIFASIKHWFSEQRGYLATGTLAAGAAAAIMFFAMGSKTDATDGRAAGARDPIAATPVNTGAKPCTPAPAVPMLSEPAAVEELSVTDGTGYILTIPGEDGENDTTVIWIEPEDKLESPI